jgi:sec-independent protein translocase protein TatA
MFGSLGAPELLIILAIVVVLFGATRLSGLGKGLGRGIRDFRKELREGQEEDEDAKKKTEATVGTATTPKSSDEKPSQTH